MICFWFLHVKLLKRIQSEADLQILLDIHKTTGCAFFFLLRDRTCVGPAVSFLISLVISKLLSSYPGIHSTFAFFRYLSRILDYYLLTKSHNLLGLNITQGKFQKSQAGLPNLYIVAYSELYLDLLASSYNIIHQLFCFFSGLSMWEGRIKTIFHSTE